MHSRVICCCSVLQPPLIDLLEPSPQTGVVLAWEGRGLHGRSPSARLIRVHGVGGSGFAGFPWSKEEHVWSRGKSPRLRCVCASASARVCPHLSCSRQHDSLIYVPVHSGISGCKIITGVMMEGIGEYENPTAREVDEILKADLKTVAPTLMKTPSEKMPIKNHRTSADSLSGVFVNIHPLLLALENANSNSD